MQGSSGAHGRRPRGTVRACLGTLAGMLRRVVTGVGLAAAATADGCPAGEGQASPGQAVPGTGRPRSREMLAMMTNTSQDHEADSADRDPRAAVDQGDTESGGGQQAGRSGPGRQGQPGGDEPHRRRRTAEPDQSDRDDGHVHAERGAVQRPQGLDHGRGGGQEPALAVRTISVAVTTPNRAAMEATPAPAPAHHRVCSVLARAHSAAANTNTVTPNVFRPSGTSAATRWCRKYSVTSAGRRPGRGRWPG